MAEFNKKYQYLENEIDIRTESLIVEIQNHREASRLKLENSKKEFQK